MRHNIKAKQTIIISFEILYNIEYEDDDIFLYLLSTLNLQAVEFISVDDICDLFSGIIEELEGGEEG